MKMDNYLAYYRCQPEAKPENMSQLVQFREFSARKPNQTSFFPLSAKVPILNQIVSKV